METLRSIGKTVLGSLIALVRPDLARSLGTGQSVATGKHLRAKRLILHARLERARWRGDHAAVRQSLAGFWQNETADFFYSGFRHRFEQSFLGPHQVIVDQLVALNDACPFSTLVEVGCGDGRVLAHCANRLPNLQRLTGLDINPKIIETNIRTWATEPRLSFAQADAARWLADAQTDGMILLSYGGVMEYFNEADLKAIYTRLGRNRRVAVAMVEPLAPHHDLTTQNRSFVFGQENSFSHNYAHLLKQAGFKIIFTQEQREGDIRWLLLLAATHLENDDDRAKH
jgi:SAM-dependent methyltransferase